MASAREVLIRYGTRNIDKALKSMRAVHKAARDAAKEIKDASKRKRELQRLKGEHAEERGALQGEQKARRARAGLAFRNRRRGLARGDDDLGAIGGRAARIGDAVGSLSLAGLASKAGPAGAIVSAVVAVLGPYKAALEKSLARDREEFERAMRVRLDERLRQLSVEQRLKDDVRFAQQRAVLFEAEARAAGAHKASHRRSSALSRLGID